MVIQRSELKVKDILEEKGYTVIHQGAPDFLCFKRNEKTNLMEEILFVEVKSDECKWLRQEQIIWQEALMMIDENKYMCTTPDMIEESFLLKKKRLDMINNR